MGWQVKVASFERLIDSPSAGKWGQGEGQQQRYAKWDETGGPHGFEHGPAQIQGLSFLVNADTPRRDTIRNVQFQQPSGCWR